LIEGPESIPTIQNLSKLDREERPSPTDKKEHYNTRQADKSKDSHEVPRHHIDNTVYTTRIGRHTTKSKERFNSIVAAIALVITIVGIYMLSVMDISMSGMKSLPETKQKLPEVAIRLRHTCFNLTGSRTLTALVVVTILTAVSLDLRRYVTITCQLQEQLIWPLGVCSMNSLSCLAGALSRSLGSQDLRKGKYEEENDTEKDQRSTSTEQIFTQTLPDKPDTISFPTREEEPNLTQVPRDKYTPSPRAAHRCV
jgi:hypothetical protein